MDDYCINGSHMRRNISPSLERARMKSQSTRDSGTVPKKVPTPGVYMTESIMAIDMATDGVIKLFSGCGA